MRTQTNHASRWTIPVFVTAWLSCAPLRAQYAGGTGDPNDPYQIETPGQMNAIGSHPEDWDKHFALVQDVNLAEYAGTRFRIIGKFGARGGDDNRPFTGTFDGRGRKIKSFRWTSTRGDHIGLFAYVGLEGRISNLRLENVDVNAPEGFSIGALVGQNEGWVTNCRVSGVVSGGYDVGGLVGWNQGTMAKCHSTASVSGSGLSVGGLAGRSFGTISDCNSTATVWGSEYAAVLVGESFGVIANCRCGGTISGRGRIGGLAGDNHGTIADSNSISTVSGEEFVGGLVAENFTAVSNCRSSGSVAGGSHVGGVAGVNWGQIADSNSTAVVHGGPVNVGGFVGWNSGQIADCRSSAPVFGVDKVGGLVGSNDSPGSVTGSHSTSDVTGHMGCGGLFGENYGTATACYSTGNTVGYASLGGLAGRNGGSLTACCATGAVTARGEDIGGLVGANQGTVSNCYATGWVWGGRRIGGLVGFNDSIGTIEYSYAGGGAVGAYAGGLVGVGTGTVTSSFWDSDVWGLDSSAGGEGKRTAQMKARSTFIEAGWDFVGETANGTEDFWWIDDGKDYPRLFWE